MNVDVFIPAAAWDDEERVAARRWVTSWWAAHGHTPTVCVTAEQPWRKGAAVNDAITASTANVIVIADADSWIHPASIDRMLHHAGSGRWVVPFGQVRRLDPDSTRAALAADPATIVDPDWQVLAQRPHDALPGGGIIAAPRHLWEQVGGFDPRFADWGGEDYALGCALHTMADRDAKRMTGPLWHLWHRPQSNVRAESPATSALAFRYRKAKYRRPDMEALLAEWRPQPWHQATS